MEGREEFREEKVRRWLDEFYNPEKMILSWLLSMCREEPSIWERLYLAAMESIAFVTITWLIFRFWGKLYLESIHKGSLLMWLLGVVFALWLVWRLLWKILEIVYLRQVSHLIRQSFHQSLSQSLGNDTQYR
mgnify:CR=1 FL=1